MVLEVGKSKQGTGVLQRHVTLCHYVEGVSVGLCMMVRVREWSRRVSMASNVHEYQVSAKLPSC